MSLANIEATPKKSISNSKNKNGAGSVAPSVPEEDGINKVREILFGQKVKEQNDQLRHLQNKMELEVERLRGEVKTQMKDLEEILKSELKSLFDRIILEEEGREKSNNSLASQMTELRSLLLGRSQALSDDIHQMQSQLRGEIQDGLEQLSNLKVDRNHLSTMLNSLAQQIGGDEGIDETRV